MTTIMMINDGTNIYAASDTKRTLVDEKGYDCAVSYATEPKYTKIAGSFIAHAGHTIHSQFIERLLKIAIKNTNQKLNKESLELTRDLIEYTIDSLTLENRLILDGRCVLEFMNEEIAGVLDFEVRQGICCLDLDYRKTVKKGHFFADGSGADCAWEAFKDNFYNTRLSTEQCIKSAINFASLKDEGTGGQIWVEKLN